MAGSPLQSNFQGNFTSYHIVEPIASGCISEPIQLGGLKEKSLLKQMRQRTCKTDIASVLMSRTSCPFARYTIKYKRHKNALSWWKARTTNRTVLSPMMYGFTCYLTFQTETRQHCHYSDRRYPILWKDVIQFYHLVVTTVATRIAYRLPFSNVWQNRMWSVLQESCEPTRVKRVD